MTLRPSDILRSLIEDKLGYMITLPVREYGPDCNWACASYPVNFKGSIITFTIKSNHPMKQCVRGLKNGSMTIKRLRNKPVFMID